MPSQGAVAWTRRQGQPLSQDSSAVGLVVGAARLRFYPAGLLDEITAKPVNLIEGADGLLRRAFSADDLRRMLEAGIMDEDERFELVEGELVFMNAHGFAHDRIKMALGKKLIRTLQEELFVGIEVSGQMSTRSVLQPDLVVGPESAVQRTAEGFLTVPAAQLLLLVEVAASSLSYDRGRKAALYAREGISEYWVIDANKLRAFVRRGPSPEGFCEVLPVSADEELRPSAPDLAGFAIRLADLS
jgi:Uma2 family endonuclease